MWTHYWHYLLRLYMSSMLLKVHLRRITSGKKLDFDSHLKYTCNKVFHTGLARIPSRAGAKPMVWTSCSSDKKSQACSENPRWTLFTLTAQLRLSSGFSDLSAEPSQCEIPHCILRFIMCWVHHILCDETWERLVSSKMTYAYKRFSFRSLLYYWTRLLRLIWENNLSAWVSC